MTSKQLRLSAAFALLTLCITNFGFVSVVSAQGQPPQVGAESGAGAPSDRREERRRAWGGDRLRVLTETDYPPFNYKDEEGVLTGFNVDLARAVCEELEVACDIRTAEWEELIPALNRGEADVLAASIAVSLQNLRRVDFTNRYFQMPARFTARKDYEIEEPIPEELEGEKIGVLKGTSHEAYLKDFYYDAKIVAFDTANAARAALKGEKVDLLFGDGVSLMFWVNGLDSGGCCVLLPGAFTESKYFGEGIGFALRKGDRALRETLNEALNSVRESGRFEELYLRYFPLRFY